MKQLELKENSKYYFDEKAGRKVIKFIERLSHYEDKYAGMPFILTEWQKKLVLDVFGWKHRKTNLRRFKKVYIEIAKGSGKSPVLAAIGIFMLLASGDKGPQVLSVASDYKQANITFDAGKKMLDHSPEFGRYVKATQYKITCEANDGSWQIISGTPKGKHGIRPTCILMDEVHEFKPNARELITALEYNCDKRSEPLIFMATNAGSDKNSVCWQEHDKAVAVLDGISTDETLYPVIYAADPEDDPADPDTWRKAIPSLGVTITEDKLRDKWNNAKGNPSMEADFKRLYLSQWIQGGSKWLNVEQWKACEGTIPYERLEAEKVPLFIAADLSLTDDLCAIARLWHDNERIYFDARHYIPATTAREYEKSHAIPYSKWSDANEITLLDTDTVTPATMERIGNWIIEQKEHYNLKAVLYDPAYANLAIATIEKASIPCISIPQKFNLSPACLELERRLKDRTIVIKPLEILRWQAGNVTVIRGQYGDIRPTKENASGTYAGKRSQKVDAITALITALTQIQREVMTTQKSKYWRGEVVLV